MTKIYQNTLNQNTNKLLQKITLTKPSFVADFYLSGGTALALQLGHRESQDLDFFSQKDFDPQTLQTQLSLLGKLKNTSIEKNTLNTEIDGVKLQFLTYPYLLLKKKVPFENIFLSSVLDIALTKLHTISLRGARKDFIDIYKIFEIYSLDFLLQQLPHKYPNIEYNLPHLLKSLVYFADAEQEPLPRLHQDIDWNHLKSTIISQVKSIKLS